MNRRHALISYEMRKMKWVLLVAVLAALFFVMILTGSVDSGNVSLWMSTRDYRYGSVFSRELLTLLHDYHIYVWLMFAIIVTIQFRDFHNKKTEEYMSSLPFTGRERFLTKVVIGYVIVFISWFVMAAGTLMVRWNVITQYHKQALLFPFYKEMLANETLWHTLRTLGVFALELMAAYSLFVLVHSIVNNSGLASAIALGIMAAPAELYMIIREIGALAKGEWMPDNSIWRSLSGVFLGDSLAAFTGSESSWEFGTTQTFYYVSYRWIGAAVVLLLVIILVCTAITWLLSKGRDMTRNSVLVSYKGARLFLAVGIGVCFGGAVAQFFPIFNLLGAEHAISFVVSWLCSSAVLGFVAWKLLKISIR